MVNIPDDIKLLGVLVFGSEERFEDWMQQPAFGLERRRPVEMLSAHEVVTILRTYLARMESGIYS